MPQLDPSSFISQIFWLIICFICLYSVVSLLITPKLDDVMGRRQKIIDDHIRAANKSKEEAKKAFDTYEEALNKANEQATTSFINTQDEMKKFIDEKTLEVSSELSKQTEQTLALVEKEKASALQEVHKFADLLIEDVIKKVGLTDLKIGDSNG